MTDTQPGDGDMHEDDRATDDAAPGDQENGVAGEPVGADDQEEALVDAVAAENEEDPAPADDADPADDGQ